MINKINNSVNVTDRQLSEKLNYVNRNNDFGQILKQQLKENKELKFSKHAQERAIQRGIDVTPSLMDDLQSAVDRAREKGAKELAIIGHKEAFIVNVTNSVVVTTMSSLEMKNNIFTNIDSAVII
ncbi:MAG: TIGR02530 family flagellar biosynthesis protein [Proteocatella sp.]